MSAHTRLFVGNLPDNTSEDVLRKAFSVYGEVTNLDIKSKPGGNDEKKFAFVTLSGTNYDIELCIKHFSTEVFNGSQLYVTRARESFLERLQRERQQTQLKEATKNNVNEVVSKKNPILKLSEKLNPRKRVNDDKVIVKHNVIPSKNFKAFDAKKTESSLPGVSDYYLKGNDKNKQDSDKKRMESMKKKCQEFKQKQMIIKSGLVGIDKVKNKKIVFSDTEHEIDVKQIFPNNENLNQNKKNNLFDEDDDSPDELSFEIKKHYEGKQGQKVLDLQSRYKSDKRFVLDERFVDEENLDEQCKQDEIQSPEDQEEEIAVGQTDEKLKQLNILQDVLGVAIKSHLTQPTEAKDNKKRAKLGMLRFDPSQPEHAKYLAPKEEMNQESLKKPKKKKMTEKSIKETDQQEQEENKVEVSKEQFYKVSDALKEAIAQPSTFSLRSLFGTSEPDEKEHNANYVPIKPSKEKKVKNPLEPGEKNPFVYDSSDSEEELESKETKTDEPILSTAETKSVWKENLFFSDIDNRLKDGLDFFSKDIQSEGPKERRELKSVMKKRIYNKERKNNMFQKKIGGRKKTMKKSYRKKS
ncbi:probable RNA-binding protein CG14230 [Plodia interpunctella]|uniref:probable RNA-binding protein CG14230 n=1 Tax=Plodia interpunctella TaxID=58824 RepID=UPI002368592B|nr:probable RNA-binding protein CG14230 [Plodia interpunctella]